MYLHLLNQNEQENFLELAYFIANCDNEFHENERRLIESYRQEMKLYDTGYAIKGKDIEEIFKELEDSNIRSKTAMFLEIMALVLADFKYDGNEQLVVETLTEKWKISERKKKAVEKWLKEMQKIWKVG